MKRITRIISVIAALTFLLPVLASAEAERLILKYKDRNIQSQTIYLKHELTKRYPGLNLNQFRLVRTVIMAKSKKGRGTIQLRVRDKYSSPYRVHGNRKGFGNSARFNYSKVEIANPSNRSDGPWQILFKGNFKLKKILLVVERRGQNHHNHYRPNNNNNNNNNPWWGTTHRPYYNQDWDRNNDRYNERNHRVSRPIVLPPRTWGTDMEGEKRCGKQSGKVADGWRYPNTICDASSSATFRGGYRPIRLFIRPDTQQLNAYNHRRIRSLQVSLALDNHGYHNSATIGITINGREYTKHVDCNNGNRHREASFTISGDWNPADIQNSSFWILPGHGNSELTIKNMQIKIKKVG